MHELVWVCFDYVLVLCAVMGYLLQSGEIAHKRVHYQLADIQKENNGNSITTTATAAKTETKQSVLKQD